MPQRGSPPDPDEFDEGPSEEDIRAFSGVTRDCPACKSQLYDDAEVCWKCGHALSGAATGKPAWIVILAVLVVATLLFVILRL